MDRLYNRQSSIASSSIFASLDGIPFKIGSKFKPPTQMVEAPTLRMGPSNSANLDYDFSMEEGVLKWADERQRQLAAQQVADEERRISQQQEEQQHSDSEEEEEEEETWNITPMIPKTTALQQPPTSQPVMAVVSSDILTPIPIHKPDSVGDSEKKDTTVDVTLFESVDDPFEKFERQTLNDIEELKNVFATTENPSFNHDSENSSDIQKNPVYRNTTCKDNGHTLNGLEETNDSDYVNVDLQTNVSSKLKKRKSKTDLPPVPPRPSLMAKGPLPPIGTPSHSEQINDLQQISCQPGRLTQEMLSQNVSVSESVYNNVFNSDVFQNVDINHKSSNVACSKPVPANRNSHNPFTAPKSDSNGKRSNDYVNVAPKPTVAPRSGSEALLTKGSNPSPSIQASINSSVDSDVPISLSRSPPPVAVRRQENTVMSPSYDAKSWNQYAPLPTPQSSASTPRISPSSNSSSSSDMASPGEVDPYLKLSPEAQRAVNNVVLMGFSRPRAARAVEKIGLDEKEVIEHLCLVNKLSENGYNAYLAETTLILFKNNMEKTETFMSLYNQFKELGFSGDKIRDALLTNDLDSEKALDQLTS